MFITADQIVCPYAYRHLLQQRKHQSTSFQSVLTVWSRPKRPILLVQTPMTNVASTTGDSTVSQAVLSSSTFAAMLNPRVTTTTLLPPAQYLMRTSLPVVRPRVSIFVPLHKVETSRLEISFL